MDQKIGKNSSANDSLTDTQKSNRKDGFCELIIDDDNRSPYYLETEYYLWRIANFPDSCSRLYDY